MGKYKSINDREPIFINPINPWGVLGANQCVKRLSSAKLIWLDIFLYIFQISKASTSSQYMLVVASGNLHLPPGRGQVLNRADKFT